MVSFQTWFNNGWLHQTKSPHAWTSMRAFVNQAQNLNREAFAFDGERADAMGGGGEDSVAHSGRQGRKRRFAETGRRISDWMKCTSTTGAFFMRRIG